MKTSHLNDKVPFDLSDRIDKLVINVRKDKEEFIHISKVREFIKREELLFKDLFQNKITWEEFWKKKRKLAGERFK